MRIHIVAGLLMLGWGAHLAAAASATLPATPPMPTSMPDGTPIQLPDAKTMAAMEEQIRKQIADAKARTSPPSVAEPAARAMAKLCQTIAAHPDWFDLDDPFAPPWTPPELKKLEVHEQGYKPDWGSAEFGGGFYHYGYVINRDADQSTPTTVAWKLTFNAEDQAPATLPGFALPADNVFSEDQFVNLCVDACNRRLAVGADNQGSSSIPDGYACTARVHILLQHHRGKELGVLIHKSAERDPHDWRDAWLAYLLNHRTDPVAAAAATSDWAERQKSYVAWIVAAGAFDQAGDKTARDATVRRMLAMKPDEPSWAQWNIASWLFPLCHALYADHAMKLCAALCRQGASYDPNQSEPDAQLDQLRTAAEQNDAAHPAPTTQWSVQGDMFPGLEVDRLLTEVPR